MESSFLYTVPAILALITKFGILYLSRTAKVQNPQTRLFFLALFFSTLLSLAEVLLLNRLLADPPWIETVFYFAASIPTLALLLHLSISISFDNWNTQRFYPTYFVLYAYAAVLEILLLLTPWLLAGIEPFNNYSVTRIPGSLYWLYEAFLILSFLSILIIPLFGLGRDRSFAARSKCKLWIVAIAPMALLVITIVILLRLNIRWFNSTVTLPFAFTLFYGVVAYSIHNHRLFDIEFFIPWSKVRKRKTAFYGRIRAMIAEIADLGSVNELINRLADTLRCPVMFLGGPRPVFAMQSAETMGQFPLEELRKIDRIIVANEIADVMPQTHALMQHHNIAAIVPFYPRSETAASWMLLGDSFSENVYTPLDFRMVEQLFDKMAELFLDKLVMMRTQLADAHRQIRTLELKLQTSESDVGSLRGQLEIVNQENVQLLKVQPADSVSGAADAKREIAATITLLGRDKDMLKCLRRHFPQTAQYVGPESVGFRRQTPPEIVVLRLDGGENFNDEAFIKLISHRRDVSAYAVYGPGTSEFVFRHRRNLLGTLIELLPERASEDVIIRKLQALVALRKATYAVPYPDLPLIGQSRVFHEMMTEAGRLAGLIEPVMINTSDPKEAAALAEYLHNAGGADGKFRALECTDVERNAAGGLNFEYADELIAAVRGGTFALINVDALSSQSADAVFTAIRRFDDVRVIASSDGLSNAALDAFVAAFRPLLLDTPSLRERRQDIEILVHYFTLQFNLQSGSDLYLNVSDVDAMMAENYPTDMAALKTAVFDLLKSKNIKNAPLLPKIDLGPAAKTLDEYVAEFEARLIDQTLRRCGGNKSKAARLLGMRPNTLHYKLERYGLLSTRNN